MRLLTYASHYATCNDDDDNLEYYRGCIAMWEASAGQMLHLRDLSMDSLEQFIEYVRPNYKWSTIRVAVESILMLWGHAYAVGITPNKPGELVLGRRAGTVRKTRTATGATPCQRPRRTRANNSAMCA
jgi:hypothetical protein